jgi:PAT family beta-lactamase induction signal transducer AmpG
MIKNLTIVSLGFSSGLPYILIFSTLGVWLADIGIDLTLIGFFCLDSFDLFTQVFMGTISR